MGAQVVCGDDIPVLFAEANDLAKNERKDLLSSLRRKLQDLQSARLVCVISVLRQHDVLHWSIINKEVDRANSGM